jgi:hypothetical protein
MTTTTTDNDTPRRKQLSDQLDRLDGIIDALGEGLNGAVADAAWEGTRLALKDAIVEIMVDPVLRASLHQATAPEPANEPAPKTQPGFWARMKAGAGRVVHSVRHVAAKAVGRVQRHVKAVVNMAVAAARAVGRFGGLKKLALVGLGVGSAVAAVGAVTPGAVAAGLRGIGGAAAAAVQVGAWTRRAARAGLGLTGMAPA